MTRRQTTVDGSTGGAGPADPMALALHIARDQWWAQDDRMPTASMLRDAGALGGAGASDAEDEAEAQAWRDAHAHDPDALAACNLKVRLAQAARANGVWNILVGQSSGNPATGVASGQAGRNAVSRQRNGGALSTYHKQYKNDALSRACGRNEQMVLTELAGRDDCQELRGFVGAMYQLNAYGTSLSQELWTVDAGASLKTWQWLVPCALQAQADKLPWPLFGHASFVAALVHRALHVLSFCSRVQLVHGDLWDDNLCLAFDDTVGLFPQRRQAQGVLVGALTLTALPLKCIDLETALMQHLERHHPVDIQRNGDRNQWVSPLQSDIYRFRDGEDGARRRVRICAQLDGRVDLWSLGAVLQRWLVRLDRFAEAYPEALRAAGHPAADAAAALAAGQARHSAWLKQFASRLKALAPARADDIGTPAWPRWWAGTAAPHGSLMQDLVQQFPLLLARTQAQWTLRMLEPGPAPGRPPASGATRMTVLDKAPTDTAAAAAGKAAAAAPIVAATAAARPAARGGPAPAARPVPAPRSAPAWLRSAAASARVRSGTLLLSAALVVLAATGWSHRATLADLAAERAADLGEHLADTWRASGRAAQHVLLQLAVHRGPAGVLAGVERSVAQEPAWTEPPGDVVAAARTVRLRNLRALALWHDAAASTGSPEGRALVERLLLNLYIAQNRIDAQNPDAAPDPDVVRALDHALPMLAALQDRWPLATLMALRLQACHAPDTPALQPLVRALAAVPPSAPSARMYRDYAQAVQQRLDRGEPACLMSTAGSSTPSSPP